MGANDNIVELAIPGAELVDCELHFGGCPHCGKTEGYMNVRSCHWFVCDAHKVCWSPAANIFSDWRQETEEVWRENARKLTAYREVEPIYSDPQQEERPHDGNTP
jgi:hypothetical protein